MHPVRPHRNPRPTPSLRRLGGFLRVPLVLGFLVVCLLAAAATEARAQACGGCAGPPVSGAGGAQRTWLREGGGSIRLGYEYEVKDETFDGRDEVVNDFDENLRTNRVSLELKYGLTDDWTASLTLHFPRFQYRLKPPGGERSEETFRGPGDTSLVFGRRFALGEEERDDPEEEPLPPSLLDDRGEPLLPWDGTLPRALPVEAPSFTVWAGVSVPTGDPEEPDPAVATEDVSVANLQTGTGTWDPLVKLRFDDAGAVAGRDDVRLWAEAAVRWPLYENEFDYRTGRSLGVTAGAETDLAPGLRANLAATFLRNERDEIDGERVAVGGGKWIYLTPGLAYDLSDRLTVEASVRLTAWRDTETKLTDADAAFQVALTWRW